MKKILIALSSLTIFTSTITTVVGCQTQMSPTSGNNGSDSEQEVSDLDYKVDLATDLKTTNLGIIDKTNEHDIIDLIGYLNPQIVSEDLKVNRIGSNYAQIVPKENSYVYENSKTGVIVNFQLQPKISLAKAILTTNLGDVEGRSAEMIKEALKKANPKLNIDEVEVVEPSIAKASAIIRANFNGIYKGQIPISYSMVAKALKEDIPNPNLGMILNNDEEIIKHKILEFNPNLSLLEVEFIEITNNSFVVKGAKNRTYYSQTSFVKGTFLTPKNSILDDLKGFDLDLGEIPNNSYETLKQLLLEKAPNLKVDEILIFDIKAESFKISSNTKGNLYYKLEAPVLISFTLPTKTTIMSIEYFKIVNYRTRIEVEALIKQKIIEKTGKKDIKIGIDYMLKYDDSIIKENEVLLAQKIIVQASEKSVYLTGKFSFEIINKLDLSTDRSVYDSPIPAERESEKKVFEIIKKEVSEKMIKQKIHEESDSLIRLLEVVKPNGTKDSLHHYYKHANKNYYQKMVINITGNHIFKAKQLIWNNIVAPKYLENEINNIIVDKTYSLSFVDSSGDKNYPHINDDPIYRNSQPQPKRKNWEYSPTITFGSFNFKERLKINSLSDFFRQYQVSLFYEWGANIWTDAKSTDWGNDGWKYGAGKEIESKNDHWFKTKRVWRSEDQFGRRMSGNGNPANLTDSIGNLSSGRKALAGYNLWIEVEGTTIKIKGQTISAYNWANASSINHAAFIYLKGTAIKIDPK